MMFYLCFCITDHGKRFWEVALHWADVDYSIKHEAIEADDRDEAMEIASQNFDLDQWVDDGVIISWDLTQEPDRTYAKV